MVEPLRTWTISFDNAFSSPADQIVQYQEAVYGLKVAFLAAGWTVVRSSNGTSAGAADHWASASDIVYSNTGAAPRSWIALAPPANYFEAGGFTSMQFLIDCFQANPASGSGPVRVDLYFAVQGYTGGTVNTRATPVSGYETIAAQWNIIPWTSGTLTGRFTTWVSTRGDVGYMIKEQGDLAIRGAFFIGSNGPTDGGGQAGNRYWFYYRADAGGGSLSNTNITNSANWKAVDVAGTGAAVAEARATPWTLASSWTNGLNYAGETFSAPIDLMSNQASGGRAFGTWVDAYAVPPNLPTGTLDDAETLQAQRRIALDDVMLYVPTGSSFA